MQLTALDLQDLMQGIRPWNALAPMMALKLGAGLGWLKFIDTFSSKVRRFCGHSADLQGTWECRCGYKRPGNYFGRCPKCLSHLYYMDRPSCGFTMDVM